MATTPNGLQRFLGRTGMARLTELRRQAFVVSSEIVEAPPADEEDFPRTITVIRREQTVAGNAALGLIGTWAPVAGLSDLVGHVRQNGSWRDKETGTRILLGNGERAVLIADIPAGGNGAAEELLTTDRLRFSDPTYGAQIWEIVDVEVRKNDGIVAARVKIAREEGATTP